MLLVGEGSTSSVLTPERLRSELIRALDALGPRRRVLALPPDFTRIHSMAGALTEMAWDHYGQRLTDVLPATGTHLAMNPDEIGRMFGRVPHSLFRVHDCRGGVTRLGDVPADLVSKVSEGRVGYSIPMAVDRLVAEGGHDLILSIGQVVPHEVVGMANHSKNVLIGAGGIESIHKTHFLGAAYGMERIMGRTHTPVRAVLNYAAREFAGNLRIVYVLTVIGRDETGRLVVRGLFIGDDIECFERAAALALEVNFEMVRPLKKVVVYLDPSEFKSTWLGNKSIYRTRMAIADGGELIVLAPGVRMFGEDPGIDRLIRRYGYVGTPAVLGFLEKDEQLRGNLSAAAHLIHGSSEGRFEITYATAGLTREEVEGVGFHHAPLAAMQQRYDVEKLAEGFNILPGGEEIFFISNPGLGLWAERSRFEPPPEIPAGH